MVVDGFNCSNQETEASIPISLRQQHEDSMLKGESFDGMLKKGHSHTLAGAGGTTDRVPLKAEICFTRDRSLSCRLAIRSPAAVDMTGRWM